MANLPERVKVKYMGGMGSGNGAMPTLRQCSKVGPTIRFRSRNALAHATGLSRRGLDPLDYDFADAVLRTPLSLTFELQVKGLSVPLPGVFLMPMITLGETIRELMERRNLSGVKLAAGVGVSPTSISKILNNHSKPRQITLTRLIRSLCTTPEEEQKVIRTYSGLNDFVPEEPRQPPRPVPSDEFERVTRYLEIKSMSVAFENDVEAVLKSAGLCYQKDFRVDPFICDFMLVLNGRRVAIDCKYNVNRDWDRTYATVKLLRKNLPCDEVVIAVPYENKLACKARREMESAGGWVVPLEHLDEIIISKGWAKPYKN